MKKNINIKNSNYFMARGGKSPGKERGLSLLI